MKKYFFIIFFVFSQPNLNCKNFTNASVYKEIRIIEERLDSLEHLKSLVEIIPFGTFSFLADCFKNREVLSIWTKVDIFFFKKWDMHMEKYIYFTMKYNQTIRGLEFSKKELEWEKSLLTLGLPDFSCSKERASELIKGNIEWCNKSLSMAKAQAEIIAKNKRY